MTSRLPPLALLCVVLVWACLPGDSAITRPDAAARIALQPALIPSPADGDALPINRIRATTTRASDGAVVDETVEDVAPTAPEWEITVTLVDPGELTAVIFLYLINVAPDGTESVQFSGRTDPIVITPGEPVTPDVPIVRGPLANLSTTSVSITSAPAVLLEGEAAALTASATTSDASQPEIFWASLNEAVATIEGQTVEALSFGSTEIVASAGAFADTVTVTVLSSDTIPPSVVATVPAPGAIGVPLTSAVTATFDEAVDPATVDAQSFQLQDSLGGAVPGTVSASGAVATFTPDTPLDSLAAYTATLTMSVADVVGNTLPDDVSWGFTTAASALLLGSFDPGLGLLVAIAFDPVSGNLFLHDDFSDDIWEYSTIGIQIAPAIQRPGLSSNDIDLDFLDDSGAVGSTDVPANTLLAHNGESAPGVLYAMNKDDGTVLDSLPMQTAGNPVGGAFHELRGSFYNLSWNTDTISEIDLTTGAILNSFSVAPVGGPPYDVFYGDLEVDPRTGNLIIVSSAAGVIRVMSPTGALVRDVDVTALGVTGLSGIAWDAATATAWLTSTNGMVYQLGGIS